MQTKEQGKQSARSTKSAGGSGRRTRTNRAATTSMPENLSPEAAHCMEGIGDITHAIVSINSGADDFDGVKLALFGTCHRVCDGLSPTSFEDEEAKLAKSLNDLGIGKHGNSATHHQRLVKEALKRACKGQEISKSTRALINKYTSAFVGMRISGVTAFNFEKEWNAPASSETNWKKGLDRYLAVYRGNFGKGVKDGSGLSLQNPAVEAAKYFVKHGSFSSGDNASSGLDDHHFSCLLRDVLEEVKVRQNITIFIGGRDANRGSDNDKPHLTLDEVQQVDQFEESRLPETHRLITSHLALVSPDASYRRIATSEDALAAQEDD